MASLIENPSTPYVGPLSNVGPQLLVVVAGKPLPNAKWFAINFQCGPNVNPRDDIALHLMPRFEGNSSKVFRNSLHNQQWGLEESFGDSPLLADQPFEIMILMDNDHFKIALNGQHFAEFQYRIPHNRINTIAIDGDVQIFSIRADVTRSPSPNPQVEDKRSEPQHNNVQNNPEHVAPVGSMPYEYGAPGVPPMAPPHAPPGGYYPQQQYYPPPAGYGVGVAPVYSVEVHLQKGHHGYKHHPIVYPMFGHHGFEHHGFAHHGFGHHGGHHGFGHHGHH